jgi:capsule polysaccharide export protein KpsE/RkpR
MMDTSIITDLEAERDALRAEVERLKSDIQEENDRLSLAAFRNLKQQLILECDRIAHAYDIRFSSEKQLRAEVERMEEHCVTRDQQLAAAVEVLRKIKSMPYAVYGPDEIRISKEVITIAEAALSRLEVRP